MLWERIRCMSLLVVTTTCAPCSALAHKTQTSLDTVSFCILYLLGLDSNSVEKRNGDSWCFYFWLMLGSIWSWRFMFISISKSARAYRHSAPLYQRTMAWHSVVHKLTGTDWAQAYFVGFAADFCWCWSRTLQRDSFPSRCHVHGRGVPTTHRIAEEEEVGEECIPSENC